MSEAYYLAGCVAASPSEAIQATLAAARARSSWIEEVLFLSGKRNLALPDLPANLPVSAWVNQPGLDGFVLQTASRMLASVERRQILIVQQGRLRSVAILLVGPQAIGVYNLTPLAQIHPGWTLAGTAEPWQAVTAALDAAEVDRSKIRWLSSGLPAEVAKACFPSSRPVPHAPPGLCFTLQAAVRSLKSSAPLAALVDVPPGQPIRILLVEKL
jgi:hypothetical protein